MQPSSQQHSSVPRNLEQATYFAVYVPPDIQADVDSRIFKEKYEALSVAKTNKKARFKAFSCYSEAFNFAVNGPGLPESTNDDVGQAKGIAQGEKPVAFRGPKSQDLVKLRKAIEAGALSIVETTVWENPRYLISSGDTPSILQEGSRYNALHVAAKCKNKSMSELILNTISNVAFVTLLYGEDDNQDLQERAKILLDLYLNTPDKGLNETPLHFAVKFGAVEVVEFLVSFPQCDRNVRNKFGKLPAQIVCERCDSVSSSVRNRITRLLADVYYVPVLRSLDNCAPPIIGQPFDPAKPPVLNDDPLQPRIDIYAYAGPMSRESANNFRKEWRTPPRSLKQKLQCKDLDKGLERLGRNLAEQHKVDWKEYWPFLDDFVDISSSEGLHKLEEYLAARVLLHLSDNSCTNTISSTGSNILSPVSDLCKHLEACKLSDSSCRGTPIAKIRSDIRVPYNQVPDYLLNSDVDPEICIEKACDVLAHRISNDILNLLEIDSSKTIYDLFELSITQLESVMASFMTDVRFNNIDYRFVHYRVAYLIVNSLYEFLLVEDDFNFMKKSLEYWIMICSKEADYHSSDEEGGNYRQDILNHNTKRTLKTKQVICLLDHILNALIVEDRSRNSRDVPNQVLANGKPCDCIWPKNSHYKRISNKTQSRSLNTNQDGNINRRLFVNKSDLASINYENDCDILNKRQRFNESIDESDDSDGYETPSSYPLCSDNSDSEEFEDCVMPEEDNFIEGAVPTKMDHAVYNAVSCVKEKLNTTDFPNIYKWYHAISSYPVSERQSWGSSSTAQCKIESLTLATSTPTKGTPNGHNISYCEIRNSPTSLWLQRIGLVSPRQSHRHLKVLKPYNSFHV